MSPRYVPSSLAPVSAREEDGRWTLVFTRVLHHAPDRVWMALTDPAELAAWAPFDTERTLGHTGPTTLTMAGSPPGEEERSAGEVRIADRPRVLEYTWGTDLLRWELESVEGGTKLVLYHTVSSREWGPMVAAGWHICLDVAERLMDGDPVGRIVADEARNHGWERLHDAYAEALRRDAASESVSR